MGREKAPPKDTSGEVPAWFMTYSDVITLLMTFFILLLTFASHEPEKFERMKVTVFGKGASDGVAGDKTDSLDRESAVFRFRPLKSRLSRIGSMTPPTHTDLKTAGEADGLKILEADSDLADLQRLRFSMTYNRLFESDGQLSALGLARVKMIARQLSRGGMRLSITAGSEQDLGAVIQLAHDMTYVFGVPVGRVAAGLANPAIRRPGDSQRQVQFTILRELSVRDPE